MKKLLSIFGAFVFMFSLIACGGGEATTEEAASHSGGNSGNHFQRMP